MGLAVRLACTLALRGRLPTVLSQPCARLRYSLGGDRPSQTTRLARSPALLQGSGLGRRRDEGSIPRSPPRGLAPPLRGLLPILYATRRRPMPSCSKGSRGLSVLPRVIRIFTNSAISPGPWSRQRPSRYAVRAGRNLPDKEFRYLRTVIVTAAVYWDFDQELAPHQLIFQHRAGITPYTSTFIFAECYVFSKQLQPPIL